MTDTAIRASCFDDMTDFLDFLREARDLLEVTDEINPRFEMGALLKEVGEQDGPAVLFTNVAGFPGNRVMGNLMGHRRRVASVFGVTEDELMPTYMARKNNPIPPVSVNNASVEGITVSGSQVDLFSLVPALTHHERDISPYMTCAVAFARDPETGVSSMGMHRVQIRDNRHLVINLATPPLSHYLQKAQQRNVPLEMAVVVGPDPAVVIASVTKSQGVYDKIEIAGGFRQKPVAMMSCQTVDLQVPATSHYLIEGEIQPGDLAVEGPFGDSTGTYLTGESSAVLSVSSVSYRDNAIYQALQPWSSEDDVLINLCFGSDLLDEVRKDYPFVSDLHIISGTLFSHLIVSVQPCSRPEIRSAMVAILNQNPFAKRVVVVDEDINIRNYREVEWAMAMRFQPDRDLLLMQGLYGHRIDPSAMPDGATTKMGIDATFPRERHELFEKIGVPVESERKSREILERAMTHFDTGWRNSVRG